ncbi:MAG: response regulator [Armatimonadetes bacterium]|nr:response regulator [Armatimonadota bacterium]
MKRILFVDDEPNVLNGLRRMLRPMCKEWVMEFAESGESALNVLAAAPFDVVVTDMRMPGMDGADLLAKVAELYPQTIRIVLSGQSSEESIFRCVGVAHQFLSKPCDAERLRRTISRACALRDSLSEATLQGLISQTVRLPSLPSAYLELLAELRSPESGVRKIAEIVSRDVGMTAKVLHLVNSAFFGMHQQVTDVERAVAILGMSTISGLVLSCKIFSQISLQTMQVFSIEALVKHSVEVGAMTRAIAATGGIKQPELDDCFSGGVLHDVGKLVLASNMPAQYLDAQAKAQTNQIPLWMVEREMFGATHAEVGAYLLGLWGLPDSVVEAVAYHHTPDRCIHKEFCLLTAVHVADILEQEANCTRQSVPRAILAKGYLHKIGVWDRLDEWRSICGIVERKAA